MAAHVQSPLARLPRELRLEVFKHVLSCPEPLRRLHSDIATAIVKPEISLFFTCKTFSIESLDVFYRGNLFVLDGTAEIDDLLWTSPQAYRMRRIELINLPLVVINDQQNLDDLLRPVHYLAAHCHRLEHVILPYTRGRESKQNVNSLRCQFTCLGTARAVFNSARYPFSFTLQNSLLPRIWHTLLEHDFGAGGENIQGLMAEMGATL